MDMALAEARFLRDVAKAKRLLRFVIGDLFEHLHEEAVNINQCDVAGLGGMRCCRGLIGFSRLGQCALGKMRSHNEILSGQKLGQINIEGD